MIPLSPLALYILKQCPEAGSFFFSARGKGAIVGFADIKKRLDVAIKAEMKPGETIPDWTFHDLRRSCSSGMQDDLKIDNDIVERCLNHSRSKLSRTSFPSDRLPEKREALAAWGSAICAEIGLDLDADGNPVLQAAAD